MPETPLRIVIVDDEPLARTVVREFAAEDPEIEIVADCANGFEAVKAVAEQSPDLVLLDVQMPKLDGFEVVELIGRATPVIFVTAYDEFAVRAFEVHAVDYLLKPVSGERLAEAIARVRVRSTAQPATPPISALRPPASERGPAERILVRDGTRVHVIDVDALDFAPAARIEQAELYALGVLGEQREVDARPVPGGAERIRRSGPDLHRGVQRLGFVHVVSSRSPRNGMAIQSGRLAASYRSSYNAFSMRKRSSSEPSDVPSAGTAATPCAAFT